MRHRGAIVQEEVPMSQLSLAPGRAREYETVYILRPDVDKETADTLTARLADSVKAEKGRLTQVELWGRRRLAYEIRGLRRGVYVYFKYLGRGNVVSELERQLRLADSVIRYQTILVRDNLVLEQEVAAEAAAQLDFALPPDADEDITRERELGLDGPFHERMGRGRHDRSRDDDDFEDEEGGMGPAAGWDDADTVAKPTKEEA
jgi:small subunit ribosomal protein S6